MVPQAVAALGWLEKVIDAIKAVRARVMRRAIKVKAYVADLLAMEQSTGADTAVWKKLDEANKTISPAHNTTLTAAEVAYLCEFKFLWDRHFKAPLKKLAELVGDEKVKSALEHIEGEDD